MLTRQLALAALLITSPAFADDWPQWLGPQRDAIWRDSPLITKFPDGGPEVVWRTPIGEGYAGPAVAGGKVYVTDRILAKGATTAKSPFERTRVDGTERVLCLDEATGKILWKHEYDCPYQVSYASGPRTTPAVAGGKVYTLGAMGDLFCFDANKGDVIWSKNLLKEYGAKLNTWGFASHPLVDGNRLIVLAGGEGSVVVAFDKDTGKELWKALSTPDPGYSPPVIHTVAGKRTLFVWHPTAINALDPETGNVIWSEPYGRGGKNKSVKAGLTVSMPRVVDDKLFLTSFYEGATLFQLYPDKAPTILWQEFGRGEQPEDTKSLNSIMPTPLIMKGHVYGICSYGELRCLDLDTGKRIWSTQQATGGKSLRWANAFLVELEGRVPCRACYALLFNEQGELILAKLTPTGYQEIDRAKIIEPTNTMAGPPGRRVVWSHPAFADNSCFVRNDREIIRVSLAKE